MIKRKSRLFLILLAVTPLIFVSCHQAQNDNEPILDTVAIEPEPLPVSGHGANGRVWGHITMHGNKGKGSVTDEHENALAVTCTRQGEELICYDQNSRQYIFKL